MPLRFIVIFAAVICAIELVAGTKISELLPLFLFIVVALSAAFTWQAFLYREARPKEALELMSWGSPKIGEEIPNYRMVTVRPRSSIAWRFVVVLALLAIGCLFMAAQRAAVLDPCPYLDGCGTAWVAKPDPNGFHLIWDFFAFCFGGLAAFIAIVKGIATGLGR